MLIRFEVSNFALIDNVNLNFESGFTAITGETGAGKSILLKALNLLLGERADYTVINQNENKCFLEAVFDLSNLNLEPFFRDNELDFDKQTIVRREFTSNGKSRCFVNDSPVQLNALKQLGEKLISIHSQHETLHLYDTEFQYDVIDHFAGIHEQVKKYQVGYTDLRKLENQLIILKETEAQNRKEIDFKSFLLNELVAAQLDKIDFNKLQEGFDKFQNKEKITERITRINQFFGSDTNSINYSVRKISQLLEELVQFDSSYQNLSERLKSISIELNDVEQELETLYGNSDLNEEEFTKLKEKLDLINSLSFKHNTTTPSELLNIQKKLETDLSEIASVEEAVIQTEKEIQKLSQRLYKEAEEISKKRKIESTAFEKTIKGLLISLAMPDAELNIELNQEKNLNHFGVNEISFLFKTNKGGQFLPLKKIASGGELSRLMLTILSTLSSSKNLPTLLFDEIDTGVSGEVASKMASEFVRMGNNLQIIAITHLPQVAAKAKTQFHVAKSSGKTKTTTQVKKLSKQERIQELAKMISGEKVTEAAVTNAENLLNFS